MDNLKQMSFCELAETNGGMNIIEYGAFGLGYAWHALKDFNNRYIPGVNAV